MSLSSPPYSAAQNTGRAGAAKQGILPPLPLFLFVLSLFFPYSLSPNIGGLTLSMPRIVVLIFFIPMVIRYLSRKQILLPDIFMFVFGIWSFISIVYNHGFFTESAATSLRGTTTVIGIEAGGVNALDAVGSYLLARAYADSGKDVFRALLVFLICAAALCIPAAVESVTGVGYFKNPFERRWGLYRAVVIAEHSILLGLTAAIAIGFALVNAMKRGGVIPWVLLLGSLTTVFFSLSAGPFIAAFIQIGFVALEYATRSIKNRWHIIGYTALFLYIVLEFASTRSAFNIVAQTLTFNTGSSYYRVILYELAKPYIMEHPFFGLGYATPRLVSWMTSSIDSFWLAQSLKFGLFPTIFLGASLIAAVFAVGRSPYPRVDPEKYYDIARSGWLLAVAAMLIAGTAVHFFGNFYQVFFFIAGLYGGLVLPATQNGGAQLR